MVAADRNVSCTLQVDQKFPRTFESVQQTLVEVNASLRIIYRMYSLVSHVTLIEADSSSPDVRLYLLTEKLWKFRRVRLQAKLVLVDEEHRNMIT